MPTPYHYDVFLSHATADKPAVETLARQLGDAGLKPFLDKWHLIPGQPWQDGLEKALAAGPSPSSSDPGDSVRGSTRRCAPRSTSA
jgi:hypothetical protein